MKGQATNILAIVAVVVIVAGAAWFKSQRAGSSEGEGGNAVAEAPEGQTAQRPVTGAEADPEKEGGTATRSGAKNTDDRAASPATANLPRLVDLGAKKCQACKALAPILDALRDEYKGRLDVQFIDVWKDPAAKAPYEIRTIPTQILFDKDGHELWRHEGFISRDDLKKLFAEKVGVK